MAVTYPLHITPRNPLLAGDHELIDAVMHVRPGHRDAGPDASMITREPLEINTGADGDIVVGRIIENDFPQLVCAKISVGGVYAYIVSYGSELPLFGISQYARLDPISVDLQRMRDIKIEAARRIIIASNACACA